ncbi:hypothetical protein DPMN_094780 [Dreissena polymorpha]|uniref:Uncharacterized protein n=1 Tax=Dreissena polymorpha TaxID=45954 RepID=A0A9D4L648_DREPO|nr:hypothetical protein DPMN_094780 [Dreissena polymorpha]
MASSEQKEGDLSVEKLISGLQNVMRLAVPAREEWENLLNSGRSETADTLFSDIDNAMKLAKQETFKIQEKLMRANKEARQSFQLELEQLKIENEQNRKDIQQLTEEKLKLQKMVDSQCLEIKSIKEERGKFK